MPGTEKTEDVGCPTDGNQQKVEVKVKVSEEPRHKRANKYVTEYKQSYTQHAFAAREPILPSAHLKLKNGGISSVDSATEYNTSFTSQPYAARQPILPEAGLQWANGEFSDSTTSKADFISYKMEPLSRHHPPQWQKPGGQIEFSTSYNEDFVAKPLDRPGAIRPEGGLRKLDAKFSGEPSYRSDYQQWTVPQPPKRFQKREYHPSTQAFGGQPTYTTDFIPRPIERRKPFLPSQHATIPITETTFNDSTDYKETYVPHHITPREVKPHPVYTGPVVPLEGLTTNQIEYPPRTLTKVESIRPKDAAVLTSTAKMGGSTTTQSDYIEWPVERFRPRERAKWQKPTEQLESITTNQEEFRPLDVQPIKRIRPPSRNRKINAPISSDTQYNQDYHRWEGTQRVKPFVPEQGHGSTAPFVGNSTYTTTFIMHPWEKPIRIKKDNRSTVFPKSPEAQDPPTEQIACA